MSSDLKQQATQTAGEKLDRLIEAILANGKLLEANGRVHEQSRRHLRQIKWSLAWVVCLIATVEARPLWPDGGSIALPIVAIFLVLCFGTEMHYWANASQPANQPAAQPTDPAKAFPPLQ
jgi:hypothetical protein